MTAPGSARPGGRTARTREAVRQATLAELAEGGFDGLTVESVAARSGVHKTTVYRRWRSAVGLAVDALDLASAEPWPVPDTGTVDQDLRELGGRVVVEFADPVNGPVAKALVSAAVRDQGAAQALHAFLVGRNEQAASVVARAVDRMELPAGTDPVEVVRAAVAPLYYRMFITGEPVSEAVAHRAADAALAAARAGIYVEKEEGGGAEMLQQTEV